jgi:hypothetical protein
MKRLAFALLLFLAPTLAPPLAAQHAPQFCSPEKLAALRAALPATADPQWEPLFADEATIFYTEREMPPAYQMSSAHGSAQYFHDTRYNISGDAREASMGQGNGGNANREFPWRMPGGTDGAEGSIDKFSFFRLPAREGGLWPIVHWHETRGGDVLGPHTVLAWIFPVDTIFGECLRLKDGRGQFHTFEVRLRIRRKTDWAVEILRPYPTAGDLAERLAAIGTAEASRARSELLGVREVRIEDLVDSRHPHLSGFRGQAAIERLPAMSDELVAELLDVPFRNAAGFDWRETDARDVNVVAPTSDQLFSLVPRHYRGAFLGNDSAGCARCHQHALRHAREFDSVRDWYGFVRGSADGILSCHIVEPSCISSNGSDRPVVLREKFLRAGLLQPYDPRKHPADRYTTIDLERK